MKIKYIPPVFYLWIGQGISSIGSIVYNIALAWYVIKQTNSPFLMGTVLIVGMIPKIAVSIIAGNLGDKLPRKNFLVFIDLLRFALTLVWGLTLINRQFSLNEIFVSTLLLSMIDAFFNPIYGALIPDLIEKDNVTRAVSINQMILRIATIISPSIAGLAIISFNFSEFVIFNSVTFLIAALFTIIVKTNKNLIRINKKNSFIIDLKSGLNYFWENKILFWSVFLITLANIAIVSYNVNLVNLVQNELKFSSTNYGLILTFFSLGSFISSILLSFIKINSNRGYLYILSLLIGGIFFVFIPFVHSIISLSVIFFLIGFAFSITSTISTAILFSEPLEEFRSRVIGIASISSLLSPLGLLIWGILGSYLSSGLTMGIAGIIILIVAFIGFKTPLRLYN